MVVFSKEKFLSYIKHNEGTEEYYTKAYDAIILKKKSFYWNWSAALFPLFWLMYRQLHFAAFMMIFLFIAFGALSIFVLIFYPNFLALLLIIAILFTLTKFVFFGLFGTSLFVSCIKKRIEPGKSPSEIELGSVLLDFISACS